ncbi:hypothetical protein NUW58_g4033 [Xylaria curta]|uniref:Uncharacterized protein n=1 Tax=Xylaria curta TaxID=42375 RepID=A0ACC1P865_9PEZI|nr:hypothetical protein NUW58_g4033 [Xylaria curta]
MEAILAQAIKDTLALRKASVPWNGDEPYAQPYFTFDAAQSSWVPKPPVSNGAQNENSQSITNVALYTWNIDFMLPFPEGRMKSALDHLDGLTSSKHVPLSTACVIFLQECTPSDLTTIAAQPWVRERFHLTDLDSTNWATTHYGTTTLVDSRLPITAAFRVHYSKTQMDRDALFSDVSIGPDGQKMKLVAGYMHEEHVYAALTAGDFNAIQPFDRTLHVDGDNNLKDAFLETGGKEDSEEGYTWGQQAATKLRDQFGCSRMDKVYYCGAVKLIKFTRFGEDVTLKSEEDGRKIMELGFEKPWVTDHLGVMAEFRVTSRAAMGFSLR